MEKAARAVRRSSVKLMSLGGGHTDLHVLLSEVKDMRNTAKAFMNAQNAVSEDLLKWAVNEENRAVQDVANQLAELNLLWSEVQREFGEHLKDYRHMFEMVLEGEKHVSQSRNNFAACEQREMKVKKELKKAFKKSSTSEIQILEGRLSQAERAKHLSHIEVTDRIRENEAVKLIRLKEGLMKLSRAYSDFARKCAVVFDAQQDIVQQLPDVLDQDLEDIKYTGTGVTRHKVQQAKERVHNYRLVHDSRTYPQKYHEPPPPYTWTDDLNPMNPPVNSTQHQPQSSPRRRVCTSVEQQQQQEEPHPPTLPSAPPPQLPTQQPSSSSSQQDHHHSTLPPSAVSTALPPPTSSSSLDGNYHYHHHHSISSSTTANNNNIMSNSFPSQSQAPIEAAAPEVPADLRTKLKPPPLVGSYGDDEDDDEELTQLTPAQAQENSVLVDFNPDWDNSYEEDLSGAMGGAKI